MKKQFKLQDLLDDFYKNFSKDDFSPDEVEIWLGVEIKRLFKKNIPKKISDKTILNEKQKIRAKCYGWNLCIEKMNINYNHL